LTDLDGPILQIKSIFDYVLSESINTDKYLLFNFRDFNHVDINDYPQHGIIICVTGQSVHFYYDNYKTIRVYCFVGWNLSQQIAVVILI